MSWIDYEGLIVSQWGNSIESFNSVFGNASNVVIGGNPPWGIADLFSIFPKWGGAPLLVTHASIVAGSPAVTLATGGTTAGLVVGVPIVGPGIPPGTSILSVDSSSQLTLSQPVSATASGLALSAYTTPLVPFAIINMYIALASASLVQARWKDMWQLAMGLYVDHFLVLWAQTNGNTYTTAGQAAAAGLAWGITVSKSAGPVSKGMQPIQGLEGWGTWNLTASGQQFATMARMIGAGPMLCL